MVGRVVSTKMSKTAVVLVESKKTHPMYGKSYVWTKKYITHDGIGVEVGDVVTFGKVKPISKMKHWQISKVLGKDIVSLEQAELAEEAAEAIAEVLPEQEPEVEEKETKAEEVKVEEEKKPKASAKKAAKPKKAEEVK